MIEVSIVKLGGSVITDKNATEVIAEDNIKKLLSQIKEAGGKVVIVHGAGSFGHPIAKKYDLISGSDEPDDEKLLAVSRTHQKVQFLNTEIVRIGNDLGLPLFPISPSSFVLEVLEGYDFSRDIVSVVLKKGLIPVLYGDMVLSETRNFTVLSGDIIMHKISDSLRQDGFNVKRVIYVSDVDGLFTADPKIDPHADLIENVEYRQFEDVLAMASGSSNTDVTQGMYGKLLEIQNFLLAGTDVSIISSKGGRLKDSLRDIECTGTRFKSKR